MHPFFEARRPHQGWTYEGYLAHWVERLQQPLKGLDKKQRRYHHYARYNFDRAERVHMAYEVSEKLRHLIGLIDQPQLWMILTEDWCADSAYSLPIFVEAARLNSYIDVRILPREDNLDIMDLYLTRGRRSIPKVIAFSGAGEELFKWGPKPDALHRQREAWLAQGVEGATISQATVDWYEEDGWHLVEEEFVEVLEEAILKSTRIGKSAEVLG